METETDIRPSVPPAAETKICSDCGTEKPIGEFRPTRWGNYESTCRACVRDKRRKTRQKSRQPEIGGAKPHSDPEFDGKQPIEVIHMMSRAKAWLESRGYSITLKGEYREVKIRTVKF